MWCLVAGAVACVCDKVMDLMIFTNGRNIVNCQRTTRTRTNLCEHVDEKCASDENAN